MAEQTAEPQQEADQQALDALFAELTRELRQKASILVHQDRSPSFATGDLLNDLYLRLRRNPAYALTVAARSRMDFMRLASEVMRNILTDAARKRGAGKRGGSFVFVTLSHADKKATMIVSPEALLDLNEALCALKETHPRRAEILQMRFYSGLSIRELQEYWGIGDATVERDIHLALKAIHTILQGSAA